MKHVIAFVRILSFVALPLATMQLSCQDEESEHDRVNQALNFIRAKTDVFDVKTSNVVPDESNLVVVIGENHANIEQQKNVSRLLQELSDKQLLDLILIEGSNGPVEYLDFTSEIHNKLLNSSIDDDTYWTQQLEWGKLAGYEHFILTNPGHARVTGVENMQAKMNFSFKDPFEEEFQILTRSYSRADRLFDNIQKRLQTGSSEAQNQSLSPAISDYRSAVDRYNSYYPGFHEKYAPIQAESDELAGLYARLESLRSEFLPALKELQDIKVDEDALKTFRAKYSVLAKEFNKKRELVQSGSTDPDVMSALTRLNNNLDQLERDNQSIMDYIKAENDFYDKYGDILQKAKETNDEIDKVSERLKTLNRSLDAEFEEISRFYTDIQDKHFIVANDILGIADGQDVVVDSLVKFFSNEQSLSHTYATGDVERLAERDNAMVENTKIEMLALYDKVAVLIVGGAHLEGISQKLTARNVSFIGLDLKGGNERNLREETLWQKRKGLAREPFFLKEMSALLLDRWKEWQRKFPDYFSSLHEPTTEGLFGEASIFNDEDRIIHLGKFSIDKNANYGNYLLDQGEAPGKRSEFYQVFSRSEALKAVKENSNSKITHAFFERQKDHSYIMKTNKGSYTPEQFRTYCAGHPDEDIVLFGVPDDIQEGGVVISELWKQLKQEPLRPRSKSDVFRTINPERAKQRLTELSKLKRENAGPMQVFRESDLTELSKHRYTPSRGDFSKTVVMLVKNTEMMRAAIKTASENKFLINKQVVLITCGDAFSATAELRESILNGGALNVWVPDRQVAEQVGEELLQRLTREAVDTSEPRIDFIMKKVLDKWQQEDPEGNWIDFQFAGFFVLNFEKNPRQGGDS